MKSHTHSDSLDWSFIELTESEIETGRSHRLSHSLDWIEFESNQFGHWMND